MHRKSTENEWKHFFLKLWFALQGHRRTGRSCHFVVVESTVWSPAHMYVCSCCLQTPRWSSLSRWAWLCWFVRLYLWYSTDTSGVTLVRWPMHKDIKVHNLVRLNSVILNMSLLLICFRTSEPSWSKQGRGEFPFCHYLFIFWLKCLLQMTFKRFTAQINNLF